MTWKNMARNLHVPAICDFLGRQRVKLVALTPTFPVVKSLSVLRHGLNAAKRMSTSSHAPLRIGIIQYDPKVAHSYA